MRALNLLGALAVAGSLAQPVSAAIIFSNADPGVTDINTLVETLAGGHESNTVDVKSVYAWGLAIPITQASTLRTAIVPFNVGPSTGLRLDVFQVPDPIPTRRGSIGNIVITTDFVYLDSSAVVDGLPSGRQWVTFSFNDVLLQAGKSYLFRASPDNTNGTFAAQQHYWLGVGFSGLMILDIRYFSTNAAIPADTFGDTHPGSYLVYHCISIDGYSFLSLTRASAVVNCQCTCTCA